MFVPRWRRLIHRFHTARHTVHGVSRWPRILNGSNLLLKSRYFTVSVKSLQVFLRLRIPTMRPPQCGKPPDVIGVTPRPGRPTTPCIIGRISFRWLERIQKMSTSIGPCCKGGLAPGIILTPMIAQPLWTTSCFCRRIFHVWSLILIVKPAESTLTLLQISI